MTTIEISFEVSGPTCNFAADSDREGENRVLINRLLVQNKDSPMVLLTYLIVFVMRIVNLRIVNSLSRSYKRGIENLQKR